MRVYLAAARWCIRHRWLTLLAAAAFFAGSLLLVPLLKTGFIPPDDLAQTQVKLELAPGSTFEQTFAAAEHARRLVMANPDVKRVYTAIGGGATGSDPFAPGGATDLNKRRLVAAVIHPQGEAGPAFGRRISHDAGGWIRTQHLERDANGERVARIVREIASVGDGPMQGRPLAIETMDESGRLVEATYFGAFPSLFELPVGGLENAGYAMPQRTIDHGLPNRLFVEFESGPTFRTDGTEEGAPLDVRPTHVVHYRDGLAWVETFTYDRAPSHVVVGNYRTLKTLDASSDAFGERLLEVFRSNVAKARRRQRAMGLGSGRVRN